MAININAKIITLFHSQKNIVQLIQNNKPLVFLNYLSLEDYIITRLKDKTKAYKGFKEDYEEKTLKYEEPEKAKKIVDDSKQCNLQETIANSKLNVDVSHNYIAGLKIAYYRQLVYNNLHDNLPIIYPLVTAGSFFAPVLMTRLCELFIYGRFGVFLYDLWSLKKSGQISTRTEDITYGFSTLAIFGLVAFTGVVPLYRFLSFNVQAIKNNAAKDVILAEQAKRQLMNLK